MNTRGVIKMLLILSIVTVSNQMYGQKKQKPMKLKTVKYEMEVNVSPEKAWEVLASYGNVGEFHSGVVSSEAINDTQNLAALGSDRICHLEDGKRKIMVKEKIIDIKNGEYYTYDVHEWENFPLKKMNNTFGVKVDMQGKTVIYQITEFRLKPRFLTWLMKGKIKTQARDGLMAYKHYMETGEKNAGFNMMHEKYKSF